MESEQEKKKEPKSRVWRMIEREIQEKAKEKDKSFKLSGKWKEFVREQEGYRIFRVDGKWVRTNLCVYFGHGGHGLVHEFIPVDEIWIDSHHYDEGVTGLCKCVCKIKERNQEVTKNYFDSSVIHEITEINLMKKGMIYEEAHEIALEKEREIGLIKDPFDDT